MSPATLKNWILFWAKQPRWHCCLEKQSRGQWKESTAELPFLDPACPGPYWWSSSHSYRAPWQVHQAWPRKKVDRKPRWPNQGPNPPQRMSKAPPTSIKHQQINRNNRHSHHLSHHFCPGNVVTPWYRKVAAKDTLGSQWAIPENLFRKSMTPAVLVGRMRRLITCVRKLFDHRNFLIIHFKSVVRISEKNNL